MKTVLLTIGNEVLNGQVIDTNAAWLAQELLAEGVPVVEKWSVADDIPAIVEALGHSLKRGDLVITTGGLGPTQDDLTCEALALFLNVDRVFHAPTYEGIEQLFRKLGRLPSASHMDQARLPAGAGILSNPAGTAPGMHFILKGKHIVSMPGVPFEMKAIFNTHLRKLIQQYKTGPKRYSHTFNTVGEGETLLEDEIRSITSGAPSNIRFSFLPDLYRVRIRIDLDSENPEDHAAWQDIIQQVRHKLRRYIAGENETTLELAIGKLLKGKGWMLGIAESCTGGMIGHMITRNAGSSDYFKGGIIAYHNELKSKHLDVDKDTLEEEGAVSEATVRQMAAGALDSLGVQVAVAVTGIAGPGGGSVEKPVGTVWIGVADTHGRILSKKILLRRDRLLNIQAASTMALILLHRFLLGE